MKRLLLAGLFSLFFLFNSFAQDINTDPYNNRVIQKYYTKNDLSATQDADYAKFKWIKYYYIHSYILTAPAADACPDYTPALVDVTDFESHRLPNRRVTIKDETCGFSITLLSQRELDLLIHYDGVLPAPNNQNTDR